MELLFVLVSEGDPPGAVAVGLACLDHAVLDPVVDKVDADAKSICKLANGCAETWP